MSDTCPTVKVSDGHGGFIVINEEDFDPKVHKKLSDKEEAAVDKATADAADKAEKAIEKETKK